MDTTQLQIVLGVKFSEVELLQQAFTHRSFINEHGGTHLDSYERMEFLGDAIIQLIISEELYQRFPELPEGELTKTRASLVCSGSLSTCARSLSLGSYILLGKGAEASGGRNSESILADVYEAMIASIFLDQGYERAKKLVLVNMANQLNKLDNVILTPTDPKSQLQEYLQSHGSIYPVYRTVSSQGPDHDPIFTIHVLSDQRLLGIGQGKKKSDAERAAARDALQKIGI